MQTSPETTLDLQPGRLLPGIGRTLLGVFLLTQPVATILFQALPATLFMWLALHHNDAARLLMLFFAVIAIYGAVGALNEYCDFALDSINKPHKPLVRGLVSKRFALGECVVCTILGLWLSLALNPLTALFSSLILVLGFWYDLHAKRSIWSWVPYSIGIPTLPLWGFAAAGRFETRLLLAYPMGALLSLALNMSNTLPDREVDAAFGLRALTHRLTLRQALLLTWSLYAGTIVAFAVFAPVIQNRWVILGPGLSIGAVLLLCMVTDYFLHPGPSALRRGWPAGAVLGILLGLAWVGSLPL